MHAMQPSSNLCSSISIGGEFLLLSGSLGRVQEMGARALMCSCAARGSPVLEFLDTFFHRFVLFASAGWMDVMDVIGKGDAGKSMQGRLSYIDLPESLPCRGSRGEMHRSDPLLLYDGSSSLLLLSHRLLCEAIRYVACKLVYSSVPLCHCACRNHGIHHRPSLQAAN